MLLCLWRHQELVPRSAGRMSTGSGRALGNAIHHQDIPLPIPPPSLAAVHVGLCGVALGVCLYSTKVQGYFSEVAHDGWNEWISQAFLSSLSPPSQSLYCIPKENLYFPLDVALRMNKTHSCSTLSMWTLTQHICFSNTGKMMIFFTAFSAGFLC